jgi:low affinity Fe/Cu permease
MTRRHSGLAGGFEKISERVTKAAGSTWAFGAAFSSIVIWAVLGPVFGYSNTWQLVINTGTTIVTFLMVFLIQRTQNKDSLALQLKLNEIVAAIQGASNRLIDVETLSEKDLEALHQHYHELAKLSARDRTLQESHSVEEARRRYESKKHRRIESAKTGEPGAA